MRKPVISAYCDDAIGSSDAVDLAARIARREVSAEEVTDAAIARAERMDPSLNAIVADRFADARKQAASVSINDQAGALVGVPTFVKDNSYLAGMPTRAGSRASGVQPAAKDGQFVKQFLSTGMIALGKSTLPEFGIPPTTESLLTGATNNPWNTEHTAGGSSGGSAALVAAGVVPIAHANDGGGSIRIPASCCGLVGLKPTRDRLVGQDGTEKLPINVVHEGVVSRTVRDTAAFMVEAEKHFRNRKLPALGSVETPGAKRLRIGVITGTLPGTTVSPDVSKSLSETVSLCESLGHHVEEISFPFDRQIADDFLHYYGMIFFAITRFGKQLVGPGFDRRKVEQFSRDFGSRSMQQAHKTPLVLWRLKRAINVTEKIYRNVDVTLTPTVGSAPPKNGQLFDPAVASEVMLQRITSFAPFTALQNITGEPAISLPLGMSSDGLPIGMHFSSRLGHDKTLLELAFELEQARPWLPAV